VRDGCGVNELSAILGDGECDVNADAGKSEDEGLALNKGAALESERVI
jgi:hypothetical protein